MALRQVKDPERDEAELIMQFMDDACRRFRERFGREDNLLEAARNARRLSFDEIFGPPLSPRTSLQPTIAHRAPNYGNA